MAILYIRKEAGPTAGDLVHGSRRVEKKKLDYPQKQFYLIDNSFLVHINIKKIVFAAMVEHHLAI